MEIIKINNINDFLKENVKYPTEILIMKNNIEEWLQKYFAPSVKIKLNMKLNLIVDGDNYGFVFDEMALLESIRDLLGIEWKSTSVTEDQKKECILGNIPAKITELKKVEIIEQLVYMFPTLHSLFLIKEASIKQSRLIEMEYSRIKPAKDAELLRNRKLHELGMNAQMHQEFLKQAYSFNLSTFKNAYAYELDQVYMGLNYILNCMANCIVTKPYLCSLDEEKIKSVIATAKEEADQKTRGLTKSSCSFFKRNMS